jgi:phosphoribosylformylglycinamidine synthase
MDKIHKGMEGLHSSVYLCSETQERFMWVCPPSITKLIINHYNITFDLPGVSKGAKASLIGKIRDDGQYIVHDKDEEIVNAVASEVTKGFLYERPYEDPKKTFKEPVLETPSDFNKILLNVMSHENMASREPIFERYDKQVQGRTHTEPGFSNSGVLTPFNSSEYPSEIRNLGIALSTDQNPRYGLISPYWVGVNATVESMRNVASVGATPHALTDCLCFGNPEKPEQMWEFVESTRGISDTCKTVTLKEHPNSPTPIIAGNVSFYNESKFGAIPPSPIVSCLGKIKNIDNAITMSFKKENSLILMIGKRKNELGGSLYYDLFDELGANVPKPDLNTVKGEIFSLTTCIDKKLILSCHDISDGGLSAALAEMTFENNIGCSVNYKTILKPEAFLFSETGGFILEIDSCYLKEVEKEFLINNIEIAVIGKTNKSKMIEINEEISINLIDVKSSWETGLREKL